MSEGSTSEGSTSEGSTSEGSTSKRLCARGCWVRAECHLLQGSGMSKGGMSEGRERGV